MAQAQSAIEQLAGTQDLAGSAYENIKSYGSSVVIPLMKAYTLYAEALKADVQKLPDDYSSSVGGEDLDSEVLQAQIDVYNATIQANQSTIGSLDSEKDADQIASLQNDIASDQQSVSDLQDKLQKLTDYDGRSSGFFSDLESLESDISAGLRQLESGVSGFNGKFTLPQKKDLKWADDVNSKFEKYQTEHLDGDSKQMLSNLEADYKNGKISKKDYETTKANLLNGGFAQVQTVMAQADKDYKDGKISKKDRDSIKEAVIKNGKKFLESVQESSKSSTSTAIGSFLTEVLKGKLTDKAIEKFTEVSWKALSQNPWTMRYGVNGALAGGGATILEQPVNPAYANFIRGASPFVKYAPAGIGAALDFTLQMKSGENVGDAAVKTGAHAGIGMAGAEVGAMIGTFGGPVGTVIGSGVGLALGTLGTMAFDYAYDHKDEVISNTKKALDKGVKVAENVGRDIGDAVSGAFSGLGSVFG